MQLTRASNEAQGKPWIPFFVPDPIYQDHMVPEKINLDSFQWQACLSRLLEQLKTFRLHYPSGERRKIKALANARVLHNLTWRTNMLYEWLLHSVLIYWECLWYGHGSGYEKNSVRALETRWFWASHNEKGTRDLEKTSSAGITSPFFHLIQCSFPNNY